MKLNLVPARQGLLWVRQGVRAFFRQPLALSGLFFLFIAIMSLASLVPLLGSALALGLQPWVVSDAHHTWPDRGLSAEALRDQISAQLAQAGATLLSLHTLVSI